MDGGRYRANRDGGPDRSAAGHDTVQRPVATAFGREQCPSMRLTPLGSAVSILIRRRAVDACFDGNSSLNATVTVPPGAVQQTTAFRATILSPQGLPLLLPLGWSPVAAPTSAPALMCPLRSTRS
jgi:hypothetical protein